MDRTAPDPDQRANDVRQAADGGPAPAADVPQAYVVYDPSRGTDEFFVLEYRRVFSMLSYDGDPWGTGTIGLPDHGLAIWWVKIDPATKQLLKIPRSMDSAHRRRTRR